MSCGNFSLPSVTNSRRVQAGWHFWHNHVTLNGNSLDVYDPLSQMMHQFSNRNISTLFFDIPRRGSWHQYPLGTDNARRERGIDWQVTNSDKFITIEKVIQICIGYMNANHETTQCWFNNNPEGDSDPQRSCSGAELPKEQNNVWCLCLLSLSECNWTRHDFLGRLRIKPYPNGESVPGMWRSYADRRFISNSTCKN